MCWTFYTSKCTTFGLLAFQLIVNTQGANHPMFVKTCCKGFLYMVGFFRTPATTSGWPTFPTSYCNSEIQDGVQDGRHIINTPYYHLLLLYFPVQSNTSFTRFSRSGSLWWFWSDFTWEGTWSECTLLFHIWLSEENIHCETENIPCPKCTARGSTEQGATGKSDEVAALLRITQINASGADVDVVNFIGKHECSKVLHLYLIKTGQWGLQVQRLI